MPGTRSRGLSRSICCVGPAASSAPRCSAAARSCANALPRRSCSSRTTVCLPTCFRLRASASCAATRSSASAGICCIRRRATRAVRTDISGGHEGPIVAATDYVRNVPDQIRPGSRRRTSRSVPTVSGAVMRARSCDGTSRWTATSLRWRRSRRWPSRSHRAQRRGRRGAGAWHRSRQGRSAQRLRFKEPRWLRKKYTCPTWATSRTWPSSTSWCSPASQCRWTARCLPSKPRRRPWTCRRRMRASSKKCMSRRVRVFPPAR